MNIARATHQLATEMSALARYSLAKGLKENALEFYQQAYVWEKKAASMTAVDKNNTDTYFVLLRSAAALAFKAKLYKESERLIEVGRSQNPPSYILEDLDDLAQLIVQEKENKVSISTTVILEGILTKVDADENEITLKDIFQEKKISIIVPRHLLLKIAKKYLLNKVKVNARQTARGVFILENIKKAA